MLSGASRGCTLSPGRFSKVHMAKAQPTRAPIQRGSTRGTDPETSLAKFCEPLPSHSLPWDRGLTKRFLSLCMPLCTSPTDKHPERLPPPWSVHYPRRFRYYSLVWAKRARQPAELVSDPTPSLLFGVEENPGKAAGEGTRVPSLGNEVYTRTQASEVYFLW